MVNKLNSEKYKNEEEGIKRLFNTISTTFIFISQAYCQFEAFSFGDFTDEEILQLKNEIFTFQVASFQFFMVVQFCKFFEKYRPEGTDGDSSLKKLNETLYKKYPDIFDKYAENRKLIQEIERNKIFKLVKDLRNKSYGHSENHPLNRPMGFILFNKTQTEQFKEMLIKAISIYKNCLGLYDIGITFHNWYDSSSPNVFLKQYLRTKAFWKENKANKI